MKADEMTKTAELHDPLIGENGQAITDATQWPALHSKWLRLVQDCLWGSAPENVSAEGRVVSSQLLYCGKALQQTVQIFYGPEKAQYFFASLILPNRPGCFAAITWNLFETAFEKPCPTEEEAIDRGYILAGFDKTQLMHDGKGNNEQAKEAYPSYTWNAIRIWAWGHSLLASYLLTRDEVDPARLVAAGHSRGGKAALAAAACDERFSVCAPINSGAGGCGCFRFLGGRNGLTQDVSTVESMGRVMHAFPHWWTAAFSNFGDPESPNAMGCEDRLPFDLHILKALIAPRSLISCEGLDDTWANPYGSYLTWKAAQPVYDLLGVSDRNRIFYRKGGHCFGAEDWHAVLDFCDEIYDGKNNGGLWQAPPFAVE